MTTAIVFGAGGFIGSHLVAELRKTGRTVYGVDRHVSRFQPTCADEFFVRDLRSDLTDLPRADEVYQLCAFLGGAGIIDGKTHDVDIFTNNMAINLSVIEYCRQKQVSKIFFSSSACVYATGSEKLQPVNIYGWEKLASERLYTAFARQYKVDVHIGRLFNIYGSHQEYEGGRERVVSALCRKVFQSSEELSILGNGRPLRSFLHVSDCVRAIQIVMESGNTMPINIGSSRLLSISDLAELVLFHSKKRLNVVYSDPLWAYIDKRACDTSELERLGWTEQVTLEDGIASTYDWIAKSCATIS